MLLLGIAHTVIRRHCARLPAAEGHGLIRTRIRSADFFQIIRCFLSCLFSTAQRGFQKRVYYKLMCARILNEQESHM